MTSIETLDFTSGTNKNMVSLDNNPTAPPPQPGHQKDTQANYEEQRENVQENNIDKEQMMELSTPLNEVMEMQTDPNQMQMMQQQSVQPQQQMFPAGPDPGMFQQQPQQQDDDGGEQQARRPKKSKSKNIGNLTDEQMDALLVGVAAGIAFSPQLQEKLVQFVPSFFNEAGVRTLGGTVATGVMAGGLFLLAKRLL
jgi:hypothetical protein